MNCVEVGHLYVGDDPDSLDPAIAAYRDQFDGMPALIMLDDYSRESENRDDYAQSVLAHFRQRGLPVRVVFESEMLRAAQSLVTRLSPNISPQRFRNKTVHFFKAPDTLVKVFEVPDEGGLRFSCPALVAALTLTRVEVWGATRVISILPETYRDNERSADALTAVLGLKREIVFV